MSESIELILEQLDELEEKDKEIESLKKQLEYLRSNEYLKQVKWERDFNEKLNDDLKKRINKAIEYIKQYNLEGVKINSDYWYDCLIELLEILKGDDK